MEKSDYILPVTVALTFGVIAFFFSVEIKEVLIQNQFQNQLFTFFSFLFGLVLTAYAILFGLVPSLNKDVRQSETMKNINVFFRHCLVTLLFGVIFSLIYVFLPKTCLLILVFCLLGLSLGMFYNILRLINTLFEFVSKESN